MTLRRRTALVALVASAACAATTAAPAMADNVPVSLTAVGGARQFDVIQTGSTSPLGTLDLGSTGSQSFRTRVRDANFETLSKSYSVTATMSNLYLRRGNGTHDVMTKVPASQVSLSKGALSADSVTADLLPKLSLNGTLPGCLTLPDAVKSTLGLSTSATSLLGLLTGITGPVLSLCNALTAAGPSGAAVSGTVDGALKQVTATVSDVTKLPNALTNGAGRSFDNADYSQDAVAAVDPAAPTAPTATGVNVMTGAAATTLPSELVASLKTALAAALPAQLVTATDTGSTTLARALDAITGTAVQTAVAALSATQQAALLNTLTPTLLDPTLATVKDITSTYYATPTLSAMRNAPVAGTYDGTLTLTFVQQ
ncbi:MAG: hypothetical protein JWN17_3273 [Frankiales bacterium]|nr:hypothetical protein [Frankiales bacterium]